MKCGEKNCSWIWGLSTIFQWGLKGSVWEENLLLNCPHKFLFVLLVIEESCDDHTSAEKKKDSLSLSLVRCLGPQFKEKHSCDKCSTWPELWIIVVELVFNFSIRDGYRQHFDDSNAIVASTYWSNSFMILLSIPPVNVFAFYPSLTETYFSYSSLLLFVS